MRNLHLTFDYSTYSQKVGEDFAKFCGLLRVYELYYTGMTVQARPARPRPGLAAIFQINIVETT